MLHLALKLARLERINKGATIEIEKAELVGERVLHVGRSVLHLTCTHVTLELLFRRRSRLLLLLIILLRALLIGDLAGLEPHDRGWEGALRVLERDEVLLEHLLDERANIRSCKHITTDEQVEDISRLRLV